MERERVHAIQERASRDVEVRRRPRLIPVVFPDPDSFLKA
jgi:hypothetical protein